LSEHKTLSISWSHYQQVDTYIRWYNERRIKLSPGAVSPKMYRQQCGLE
ncbi:TPA: IS3 family transposase, partial [Escherichia coli]